VRDDRETMSFAPSSDDSTEPANDDVTGGDEAANIEADIAETREQLTGTVEEIGHRLEPSTILGEAKQTVRDATVGKVETMTSTATDALSGAGYTIQETGGGLLDTIKQNPIPAAMAAVGIGWLWTHRSGSDSSRYMARTDSRYTNRGGPRSRTAWDSGYDSAAAWSAEGASSEGIGEKVGDLKDAVSEKMSGVGDRMSGVGETVGSLPQQVGGNAQGLGRQAQQVLDESPLAVGAAALAIGAVIGMALPSTQVERRVLGPAGEKVIESVEGTATDALQKAQEDAPV